MPLRCLKSFGGSGYDIACAQNDTPIYHLDQGVPSIEQVTLTLHLQIIYTLYT
jgi:hypothetical protein